MDDLRGSLLGAERVLGSREAAWRLVLDVVAAAHDLGPWPLRADLVACWAEPAAADALGAVHESVVAGRGSSGTFYTPPGLVSWVLDRAVDPLLTDRLGSTPLVRGVPRVLDPACGSGAFLLAVVRRVVDRLGVPASAVVPHVHGVDLDPVAVEISRLLLRIEAPDAEPVVRVADGLGAHPGAPYDAVLGNPPFLGRLRRRTATDARARPAAYTDTSALFLQHALGLVRPGGTVALVQPLSLLAVRDAGPVRRAVTDAGAVTAFWASADPVFAGTDVPTCAPVVVVGAEQGPVATWHGTGYERGRDLPMPPDQWGPLAAPALGVPPVVLDPAAGVLGDLGPCTADFRDQYYGLVSLVHEAADRPHDPPLVTSGLIDPAVCRWGTAPTRFAKTVYAAPVVDLGALHADGSLSAWARARLVPKVLVATQGRVIEAVVDEAGAWLPSVPVLTLVPPPGRLWHALAVLLAPPVSAYAAARYLGAGLSAAAVKLSASQVAALPLPTDPDAWDEGARLARLAQTGPARDRAAALVACAEVMGRAYGDPSALGWWLERVRR